MEPGPEAAPAAVVPPTLPITTIGGDADAFFLGTDVVPLADALAETLPPPLTGSGCGTPVAVADVLLAVGFEEVAPEAVADLPTVYAWVSAVAKLPESELIATINPLESCAPPTEETIEETLAR